VYYKPFVRLIWLGALLMSFGALLSMFDRRYRMHSSPTQRVEKRA